MVHVSPLSSPPATRRLFRPFAWLVMLILIGLPSALLAGGMLEIADLVARPDQYDRQAVVVVGQVSNLQTAANKEGQSAYGFLLKAGDRSVKVIGLGKTDVHEGDQVMVEGVFSRLRQTGRAIVLNEIKANTVRSLDRLNPDLVG
jgi:hypothetical protein